MRVLLPAQVEGQDLVVETATVEHDRSGSPAQAFVVTRTADGARVAAATPYADAAAAQALSLTALPDGRSTHVGRTVRLVARPDGTALVAPR